jgi:hypothetical protein
MTVPGVLSAAFAPPGNDLVGHLARDQGVPACDDIAHLRNPVQPLVAELLHLFDALHELRELLELGPLVIGGS